MLQLHVLVCIYRQLHGRNQLIILICIELSSREGLSDAFWSFIHCLFYLILVAWLAARGQMFGRYFCACSE